MSRKAIPLENHHSLDKFEDFASSCDIIKVYGRVNSIIDLMNGESRAYATKRGHMTTNVFRFWIKRYNEFGLDDLIDLKSTVRLRRLQAA